MTRDYLKKIREFPVGTPFYSRDFGGEIRYGWVTGYGVNTSKELILKVKWTDQDEESLIHPFNIRNIQNLVEGE